MIRILATLAAISLLAAPTYGQPGGKLEGKDYDSARAELKALREEVTDAINKGDTDRLLKHVHPDVIMTAPNADPAALVSRGHKGVKAYYDQMLTGPDRKADKVTINPTVEGDPII